jgi:hypothetical protein
VPSQSPRRLSYLEEEHHENGFAEKGEIEKREGIREK